MRQGLTGLLAVIVVAVGACVQSPAMPQLMLAATETTLTTGLRLVVHPDPASTEVAVSLWLNVGSSAEADAESGLAHLGEHVLLHGTRDGDQDLRRVVRSLGGRQVQASTSYDRTRVLMVLPPSGLPPALDVLAQRLTDGADGLTASILETAAAEALAEIAGKQRQPDTAIHAALWELTIPPQSAYRRIPIGSAKAVGAVGLERVRRWIRDGYTLRNAVLAVAGPVDPGETIGMVRTKFVAEPAEPDLATVTATSFPSASPGAAPLRVDGPQSVTYLVWNVPGAASADAALLDVLRHVVSRQLEREIGSSSMEAPSVEFDMFRGLGQIRARVPVPAGEDADVTAARVGDVVRHLVDVGPSTQEVAAVAAAMIQSFAVDLARHDVATKADLLARSMMFDGSAVGYVQYFERVRQASAALVHDVARRWLGPTPFTVHVATSSAAAD